MPTNGGPKQIKLTSPNKQDQMGMNFTRLEDTANDLLRSQYKMNKMLEDLSTIPGKLENIENKIDDACGPKEVVKKESTKAELMMAVGNIVSAFVGFVAVSGISLYFMGVKAIPFLKALF